MNSTNEEIDYLSLQDIQHELLDILKTSKLWFLANDIHFSLSDGSLLGAIRHKGFVPWDDDLDIYMPRPDYERFLTSTAEFEKATGFEVRSRKKGKKHFPFTKIVNPAIRAQEESVDGFYEGYLWVDVFPIDAVPDSDAEYKKLLNYRNLRIALISLGFVQGSRFKLVTLAEKIGHPFFSRVIDPFKLANQIDEKVRQLPYDATSRVACPAYGLTFAGKSLPKDEFEHVVSLPFEDTEFPCMSCWDEYLSKSYGDYMKLPPEEKRWTHPQKVWRINPEQNKA